MGLAARLHARSMAAIISEDIVPTLAIKTPLDSSLPAEDECASVPCFIQVSDELAVTDNFSGSSGCSDEHSLMVLLNKTKKKLTKSKE